tara:strand:- start:3547 stop:4347 length:801 start_codon:yes stop_codon:yes gene_type:complete
MKNLTGIQKWVDLKKGFEPNVSASKLSLFKNDLPMFICKYGFGKKQQASPSMHRGIIVEDAIAAILLEKLDVEAAIERAINRFNQLYIIPDDRVLKEATNIPPMIRQSYEALKDYGKPEFAEDGKQEKIQFDFIDTKNDWSIPIVGFLDLVFPESGQIIDLKTTAAMPSTMSADHQLQRSIYQKAKSNYTVKFLYVTKSKFDFKEDGDPDHIMEEARLTINRLDRFCDTMTPDQARQCIPIQNNFYWVGEDHMKKFYNQEGENNEL